MAPIVQKENLSRYFYTKKKYQHNLEWMGMTLNCKELTLKHYPSCIHVDETSRVQVVSNKNLNIIGSLKINY